MMKRLLSLICVCFILLSSFCVVACAEGENDHSHLEGTTLNVYNWGEYISDGADDTMDVNKEFEKRYGITVNYTNYESNENMYNKLKSGGANYDVIIPSDYMIAKLVEEEMLAELDYSNIPNYKYILDKYKNLYYDPENKYTVPYTVGMVGLIYNTAMVDGEIDSWNALWDEQYKGKILMFNNPRDAFGIAQFLLGQSINTTDLKEWDLAIEKLKEQGKPINLAISLHAVKNDLRTELMPVNKGFNFVDVITAAEGYSEAGGRQVTYEYILIKDKNDSVQDAELLSNFLRFKHATVNLIPANPVPEKGFERPSKNAIERFVKVLQKNKVNATVRKEMGKDIDAACGQLRAKFAKEQGKK